MDQVKQLREQAERCFQLAREATDQELRTQLEVFGRELAKRVDNIEHKRP